MAIINRKELTELMTTVAPIAEPTMIDLQNFRKKVANALFTNESGTNIKRHAWLVETKTGHQKRMGKANATLPTAPTEPIEPTGTTVSNMATYETAEYWDQEIINVLQVKFPTCLTDLEIEDGMLPLNLNGRLVFEHIDRKFISSTVAI